MNKLINPFLLVFLCLTMQVNLKALEDRATRVFKGGVFKVGFWPLRFKVYKVKRSLSDKEEVLSFKYLRDVDQDLSCEGWKQSLERMLSLDEIKDQIKLLCSQVPDIKEGDLLKISKLEEQNLVISLSEKTLIKSTDKKLLDIIFLPWLGEKPIDDQMKKDLLGEK